jgi:hypothetical protein
MTELELAQQLIRTAMALAEIDASKPNRYTNGDFVVLKNRINDAFNKKGLVNEKTYDRFWKGEAFTTSIARVALSAYVLYKKRGLNIHLLDLEEIKDDDRYWNQYKALEYSDNETITEQQQHEIPIICIKKYKAYFFSHIRYTIWDKGSIELRYTSENSGSVIGSGFYRGKDDDFKGTFEIVGDHISMDLKGTSVSNWFKLIGKIDAPTIMNADYFRAAYVTISSYSSHYISAIEAVFVEQTYAVDNPHEVEKVRRYLMLQRNRFQSDLLAKDQALKVPPSDIKPNDISSLIGSYICISRINDYILVSSLIIDNTYNTKFRTRLCQDEKNEKNYQLCYFEIMKGNILIKGYHATPNDEEPNLQCVVSTFIIPIINPKNAPIKGTFNSIIEIEDEEILWAGECYLLKLKEPDTIKPFFCLTEKLSENFTNEQGHLYQKILDLISK